MFAGLVLVLAALPATLALEVRGELASNYMLNTTNLPIDSYVDLDYGAATAPFRADGTFNLGDVKPGQHIVRPMVRGFAMTDLIVTVPPVTADSVVPHVQAFIPGKQALPTSAATLDFPLKVGATYEQSFYTPPNSMNLLQMLKSPMVLMVLFSGIMAVAMPKLTAGMDDPEMAKEMAAQRKRMTAASQMDWTGALASRLAGERPSDGTTASPSAGAVGPGPAAGTSSPGARTPAARGGTSGGGGGKRGAGKRR